MKTQPNSYNFRTRFWYKTLHCPIYLKKSLEISPKNPKLTVIFLHGISADSTTWKKTFQKLGKNSNLGDVRFLALDLLGFGNSLKADWQNYTFAEFDRAIINALKKYRVKTPIILVGHSMGCLIAAHFANGHKKLVKELVLISPPVIKKAEIAKLPDKFYTKTYASIEKVADASSIKALAKFVESASSFRGQYLDTKAFNATMKNIILNPANFELFSSLKTPTVVINGRLDPLVIGKNLDEIAKNNSKHVKLVPVMSSHDISKQKYDHLVAIIERNLR